jgi:protein phosphatase 1 regulatory subunit 3A/B/C/D/E
MCINNEPSNKQEEPKQNPDLNTSPRQSFLLPVAPSQGSPRPRKSVQFREEELRIFNQHQPPILCNGVESEMKMENFSLPCLDEERWGKLETQNIVLEEIFFKYFMISGRLLVKNLSFQKRVFVRYSINNWEDFSECTALHHSSELNFDYFRFSIDLLDKFVGQRLSLLQLQFCFCFSCDGAEFWDSNEGKNYICTIEAIYRTPPTSPRQSRQTSPTAQSLHSSSSPSLVTLHSSPSLPTCRSILVKRENSYPPPNWNSQNLDSFVDNKKRWDHETVSALIAKE